ncbi:WD40 repeat-like protein [Leucogyrophana mollusca]|uniref:WD40 repeat-like protein n=1 Tax=Leucogyrophana mollusca TaxID=85980 RepID=A0ACB8BED3_9AGAM|nr:WD40 repeat-like protein [Leucogyrophana mollusca]
MSNEPEKIQCILRIIGAENLPHLSRWTKKLPNAFVTVKLDDIEHETNVVRRSSVPTWDESFELVDAEASSVLSLEVRHKPHMGLAPKLASISIQVEDLAHQCLGGQEIELELNSLLRARANESNPPRIKISLSVTESGAVIGSLLRLLDSVLSKIDDVVKIVNDMAEVHPYAKFALTLLSSAYKVVQKQISADQTIVDLMMAMEAVYSFISVADNLIDGKLDILQQNITTILLQTVECAAFIRDYAYQGFSVRVLDGTYSAAAGTCKRLIQGLHDLQANFETGIGAQPVFVSYRTHGVVAEISINQILDRLMPADMHGSEHSECLPGTRQELLSRIISWATDINCGQNVFWLHGVAGSGKSTVATTVAKYIGEMHRLGAFICFNWGFAECIQPSKAVQTLAHKLGMFDKRIGKAISRAIDGYPGINDASLSTQFTELLVRPLSSLASLQDEGTIVVVLDALNECGSESTRASLLQVLKSQLHQIPCFIRILITSRPLDDIREALEQQKVHNEDLDISSISNSEDISAFFHEEIKRVKELDQTLSLDWPEDEKIDKLTLCACGLFIWASTALKFIREDIPTRRLEAILAGNATEPQAALDQLYKTILKNAGIWSENNFVVDFHDVLGVVLIAQRPLTTLAIDKLLSTSRIRRSAYVVSRLCSVLSYDPVNPTVPVQILHPSFADFLFDIKRSGQDTWHYINKDSSHRNLAIACLKKLCLKRNICNMTLANQGWKSENLAEDITYACLFWVDHVVATADSSIALIVPYIEEFLQEHLLQWFEAMSILRKSRETIRLLQNLFRWLPVNLYHNLRAFVQDACRFAQQSATAIEEHPLLVYHSALPFAPKNSLTYKSFYNHKLHVKVTGLQGSWTPMLLRSTGHNWVLSVAFSPDGAYIITGSSDRTICVWDAFTSTQVLPPLQGHQDWVRSVVFSPNGTHIASGSDDKTICVWDAFTGIQVLPPMRGHQDWVLSVAFSPNGAHIVSGSSDKTICVWDAFIGTQVLPPLQGHQGSVRSVAFSPDGTHIISGSDDKTIRVWDVSTGAQVLSPMQGHQSVVQSVTFSPDGAHIISGSDDKTICIWDISTGTHILPPIQGHQSIVHSVVFSPDGAHIASGSQDGTICVWDASTGTQVYSPLKKHKAAGSVLSVAFSPDGTRIVSGSDDKTICVWDASTGAQVLPPMQGHQGAVLSVTFSPDGTYIVSGSYDNTIGVWNASTGTRVLSPMQEHQGWVQSVIFSSDGSHILSCDVKGQYLVWDVEIGLLSASYDISNFPSSLTVVNGQWIVDQPKNQTLGRIPSYIRCLTSASWGTSLAIGCEDGQVIVMDFPPLLCASSETIDVIPSEVRDQNDGAFISEKDSSIYVSAEENSTC